MVDEIAREIKSHGIGSDILIEGLSLTEKVQRNSDSLYNKCFHGPTMTENCDNFCDNWRDGRISPQYRRYGRSACEIKKCRSKGGLGGRFKGCIRATALLSRSNSVKTQNLIKDVKRERLQLLKYRDWARKNGTKPTSGGYSKFISSGLHNAGIVNVQNAKPRGPSQNQKAVAKMRAEIKDKQIQKVTSDVCCKPLGKICGARGRDRLRRANVECNSAVSKGVVKGKIQMKPKERRLTKRRWKKKLRRWRRTYPIKDYWRWMGSWGRDRARRGGRKAKKKRASARQKYRKAFKAWLSKNPRPTNKQGFTNMNITNMNFTTNCCIIIFILIVVFLFKKEIMNFLK